MTNLLLHQINSYIYMSSTWSLSGPLYGEFTVTQIVNKGGHVCIQSAELCEKWIYILLYPKG